MALSFFFEAITIGNFNNKSHSVNLLYYRTSIQIVNITRSTISHKIVVIVVLISLVGAVYLLDDNH